MRMWNVDPALLCNKHLLGEHVEMHMFAGCIKKGKNLRGFVEKGLVEVDNIKKRHTALVEEMECRGMNHKSDLSASFKGPGWVDVEVSYFELSKRCERCRDRIATVFGDRYKQKGGQK